MYALSALALLLLLTSKARVLNGELSRRVASCTSLREPLQGNDALTLRELLAR